MRKIPEGRGLGPRFNIARLQPTRRPSKDLDSLLGCYKFLSFIRFQLIRHIHQIAPPVLGAFSSYAQTDGTENDGRSHARMVSALSRPIMDAVSEMF